jgi:hypothetical protein
MKDSYTQADSLHYTALVGAGEENEALMAGLEDRWCVARHEMGIVDPAERARNCP